MKIINDISEISTDCNVSIETVNTFDKPYINNYQLLTKDINPDKLPYKSIYLKIKNALLLDCSCTFKTNNEWNLIYLKKIWNIGNINIQKFLSKVNVKYIKGYAIQLCAGMGWRLNHFIQDTFIRLAIVYDKLINGNDEWKNAKIIVGRGPNDGKSENNPGELSSFSELMPFVQWIFKKLKLENRLISSCGWICIAKSTYKIETLIYPDVYPIFISNHHKRAIRVLAPRNILHPLQKALGILDDKIVRNYVIYAGRTDKKIGLIRKVEAETEKKILEKLEELIKPYNLKLINFNHTTVENDYNIFRKALIILGPHGQQLANMVFSKPETLVMEFITYKHLFTNKTSNLEKKENLNVMNTSRFTWFNLANACGHEYFVVNTPNFDFISRGLKPDINQILDIVSNFLQNN